MSQTVLLGELVNIRSGKSRPKLSGSFPVYGGNGIFDSAPEPNMTNPTVIVGRVGAYCGSTYIERRPFWLSDNALGITAKPDTSLEYVYYLLKALDLNNRSVGGAQPLLTQGILNSIPVQVPGLNAQNQIANILGTIDEKIELNRQMNEVLEQIGHTLYEHYFIDNPEASTWPLGALVDLIDLNPRESLKKGEESPYLEMKNLSNSLMSIDGFTTKKFNGGTKFRNGDTLLARITPCLENGKTAFVDFLEYEQLGFGSTEYIVMRPKNTKLAEYTYLLSRSDVFRAHAIQSMVGTSGRQRVQNDSVATYGIKIPDVKTIAKFHYQASALFSAIKNNADGIKSFTELKELLLPRLISGKIEV